MSQIARAKMDTDVVMMIVMMTTRMNLEPLNLELLKLTIIEKMRIAI